MATLLIIDDDPKICLFMSELAQGWGYRIATANSLENGNRLAGENCFDLVLLDLELPDGNGLSIIPDLLRSPGNPEVIIITGTGNVRGAELAFKYGAWDYVQKPFTSDEAYLPVTRALAYRAEKRTPKTPFALDRTGIVGESPAIVSCLDDVARACVTDASVLITGETGTGKELFARAIHRNSSRYRGAFVPIDCGGIAESLAESIFFGHEKGAFTGADAPREGIIRQAAGGTFFLDEIGDLPLNIQKSLLRALQEKRIRPLGGQQEIAVDFRLVAATNRNLKKMVTEHKFREDLLFRIGALRVALPALRDRGDDIREITLRKIHQMCEHHGKDTPGVSAEFMDILAAHRWPGNVRELINVLEYALASADWDPTLHPKHLPPEYRTVFLSDDSAAQPDTTKNDERLLDIGDQFPTLLEYRAWAEKKYLKNLIKRAAGNRENACNLSGMSQARLYALMKKYKLSFHK
jgi:two-component system NtrC family response regulator